MRGNLYRHGRGATANLLAIPRNKRTGALLLIVLGLIGTGGYYGYKYVTRDTNPIPIPLRSELTFSPFVIPEKVQSYTVSDYKFNTAENKVQILTYVVHAQDGINVSVSEYQQPSEFTDIPEYKDRFLSNIIKQYATVQTASGNIYLGRLPKQDNRQLGVMLERGLLVFLNPDKELSETQWHQIGDVLEIQKVADEK
jgi:hypothetical protein